MTNTPEQEKTAAIKVHIRWMIRKDMAEVLDIERRTFEFPRFEEDFIRCLRQRNCIGMVAEKPHRCTCGNPDRCKCPDPPVIGYVIYELHKSRLHVLNCAVAYDYRRCGVGRQIVEKLTGKLSSQRRVRITLEVRETNLEAQLFFKALGFRAVTVLRDFYEDSPEDAYLMQWRLGDE